MLGEICIYGEHWDFLLGAWVLDSGERVWA